MESLNTPPPDDVPVEFVDWPFSKLPEFGGDVGELFDRHARVVADHEPRYAVAPDVMGDLSLTDVLDYADQLWQYCDTVIVVPKSVHPSEVPAVFRTGMPCQERYGPTPWQWQEYESCAEVHLLGGSPVKHSRIMKHYVPVESVDTSVPIKPAKFGEYWSAEREKWTPTESLGFYDCLRYSYSNMKQTMNPDRDVRSVRQRNRRLDYEKEFADSENASLWGADEQPPFPGRGYYRGDDD